MERTLPCVLLFLISENLAQPVQRQTWTMGPGPILQRLHKLIFEILWKFSCFNFESNDQIKPEFGKCHNSSDLDYELINPWTTEYFW